MTRMTRADLNLTIAGVTADLNLTSRCVDVSSTYSDYVVVTFFVPKVTGFDAVTTANAFRRLTAKFGWQDPNVLKDDKSQTIRVTLQKANVISSSDGRLT
jgi:hypothetical protein